MGSYTWQPGDTWKTISKKMYGTDAYWATIMSANKSVSVKPGVNVNVPNLPVAQPQPVPSTPRPPVTPAPRGVVPTNQAGKTPTRVDLGVTRQNVQQPSYATPQKPITPFSQGAPGAVPTPPTLPERIAGGIEKAGEWLGQYVDIPKPGFEELVKEQKPRNLPAVTPAQKWTEAIARGGGKLETPEGAAPLEAGIIDFTNWGIQTAGPALGEDIVRELKANYLWRGTVSGIATLQTINRLVKTYMFPAFLDPSLTFFNEQAGTYGGFWREFLLKDKTPLVYNAATGEYGYWDVLPSGLTFRPEGQPLPAYGELHEPIGVTDTGEILYADQVEARIWDFERMVRNPDGSINWANLIGKIDPLSGDYNNAIIHSTGVPGLLFSFKLHPDRFQKFVDLVDKGADLHEALVQQEDFLAELITDVIMDPTGPLGIARLGPMGAKADLWISRILFPAGEFVIAPAAKYGLAHVLRNAEAQLTPLISDALRGKGIPLVDWMLDQSKNSRHAIYVQGVRDAIDSLAEFTYDATRHGTPQEFWERVLKGDKTILDIVELGPRRTSQLLDSIAFLNARAGDKLDLEDLLKKYGAWASMAEVDGQGAEHVFKDLLGGDDPRSIGHYITEAVSDQYAKQLGLAGPGKASLGAFLQWTGRLAKENWLGTNPRYIMANFIDNYVKTVMSGYKPTFEKNAHLRIAVYLGDTYHVVLPDNTARNLIADALDLEKGMATDVLPWPLGKVSGWADTWYRLSGRRMPEQLVDWMRHSGTAAVIDKFSYRSLLEIGFSYSSRIEKAARANIFLQAFEWYMENKFRPEIQARARGMPDLPPGPGVKVALRHAKNGKDLEDLIRKSMGTRGELPPMRDLKELIPDDLPANALTRDMIGEIDELRLHSEGLGVTDIETQVEEIFSRYRNRVWTEWQERMNEVLFENETPMDRLARMTGLWELEDPDTTALRAGVAATGEAGANPYLGYDRDVWHNSMLEATGGVLPQDPIYRSIFEAARATTPEEIAQVAQEISVLSGEETYRLGLRRYNEIYRVGQEPITSAADITEPVGVELEAPTGEVTGTTAFDLPIRNPEDVSYLEPDQRALVSRYMDTEGIDFDQDTGNWFREDTDVDITPEEFTEGLRRFAQGTPTGEVAGALPEETHNEITRLIKETSLEDPEERNTVTVLHVKGFDPVVTTDDIHDYFETKMLPKDWTETDYEDFLGKVLFEVQTRDYDEGRATTVILGTDMAENTAEDLDIARREAIETLRAMDAAGHEWYLPIRLASADLQTGKRTLKEFDSLEEVLDELEGGKPANAVDVNQRIKFIDQSIDEPVPEPVNLMDTIKKYTSPPTDRQELIDAIMAKNGYKTVAEMEADMLDGSIEETSTTTLRDIAAHSNEVLKGSYKVSEDTIYLTPRFHPSNIMGDMWGDRIDFTFADGGIYMYGEENIAPLAKLLVEGGMDPSTPVFFTGIRRFDVTESRTLGEIAEGTKITKKVIFEDSHMVFDVNTEPKWFGVYRDSATDWEFYKDPTQAPADVKLMILKDPEAGGMVMMPQPGARGPDIAFSMRFIKQAGLSGDTKIRLPNEPAFTVDEYVEAIDIPDRSVIEAHNAEAVVDLNKYLDDQGRMAILWDDHYRSFTVAGNHGAAYAKMMEQYGNRFSISVIYTDMGLTPDQPPRPRLIEITAGSAAHENVTGTIKHNTPVLRLYSNDVDDFPIELLESLKKGGFHGGAEVYVGGYSGERFAFIGTLNNIVRANSPQLYAPVRPTINRLVNDVLQPYNPDQGAVFQLINESDNLKFSIDRKTGYILVGDPNGMHAVERMAQFPEAEWIHVDKRGGIYSTAEVGDSSWTSAFLEEVGEGGRQITTYTGLMDISDVADEYRIAASAQRGLVEGSVEGLYVGEIDTLEPYLSRGANNFNLGGEGELFESLDEYPEGWHEVNLSPDSNAVETIPEGKFIENDLQDEWTFAPDGTVDNIVTRDLVDNLSEGGIENFPANAWKKLRPGGRAILRETLDMGEDFGQEAFNQAMRDQGFVLKAFEDELQDVGDPEDFVRFYSGVWEKPVAAGAGLNVVPKELLEATDGPIAYLYTENGELYAGKNVNHPELAEKNGVDLRSSVQLRKTGSTLFVNDDMQETRNAVKEMLRQGLPTNTRVDALDRVWTVEDFANGVAGEKILKTFSPKDFEDYVTKWNGTGFTYDPETYDILEKGVKEVNGVDALRGFREYVWGNFMREGGETFSPETLKWALKTGTEFHPEWLEEATRTIPEAEAAMKAAAGATDRTPMDPQLKELNKIHEDTDSPVWRRKFILDMDGMGAETDNLIGVYTPTEKRYLWSTTAKFHGNLAKSVGENMPFVQWSHLKGEIQVYSPTYDMLVEWAQRTLEYGPRDAGDIPISVTSLAADTSWPEGFGDAVGLFRKWTGTINEMFGIDSGMENLHTDISAELLSRQAIRDLRASRMQEAMEALNGTIGPLEQWHSGVSGYINGPGGPKVPGAGGWGRGAIPPDDYDRYLKGIERLRGEWDTGLEDASFYATGENHRILFDYSSRGNSEEILRQYGPFTTWQLRNPLFWAQVFAKNPNMINQIYRFAIGMERERRRRGLSERFKGTLGVEIPENQVGLPPGYWATDPTPLMSIFQQFKDPFEMPGQPETGNEMMRQIQWLIQQGKKLGVSPWPWWSWLMEQVGMLPEGSTNISTGVPQRLAEIGLRSAGVLEPGKPLIGSEQPGVWINDYNVNRRLAEMEAEGSITHEQFLAAFNNKASPEWEQAQQDVLQLQSITGVTGSLIPFNLKYASEGEELIRSKVGGNVTSDLRNFYETQFPYLRSYGLLFDDARAKALEEINTRYDAQLAGLMPWDPRYKEIIGQRSEELNGVFAGQRPTKNEAWQRYPANPVEVGEPDNYGVPYTEKTARTETLYRLNDMEPRASEYKDDNGVIDWDAYDRNLESFYSGIEHWSAEIGIPVTTAEYLQFKYRNSAPQKIAYNLYREFVGKKWDGYNLLKPQLEPGTPTVGEHILWAVEQQAILDSAAGFTPIEVQILKAENAERWALEGLPYEWRQKILAPYLTGDTIQLSRFARATAELMGMDPERYPKEAAQLGYTLMYELPGMFGNQSVADHARSTLYDYYYDQLTPSERNRVNAFFGLTSFVLPSGSPEADEQVIKMLEDLRKVTEGIDAGLESLITCDVSGQTTPVPPLSSVLTPQEIKDLTQLRIDTFRYYRAQDAGVGGTYTDLMERCYSDPTSAKGRFWGALSGLSLSSAAFDDPVIAPFMNSYARDTIGFTDEQYLNALAYFEANRDRLVDAEATQKIQDHPDWYEQAQQERDQFNKFRVDALEQLKSQYYSIYYKDRKEWEAAHPDEWSRLKPYLEREKARALQYPYFAYFYKVYDYGQYYGSATPDQVSGGAPQLSSDFQQAMQEMEAWMNGSGEWTDLMVTFFGPRPLR